MISLNIVESAIKIVESAILKQDDMYYMNHEAYHSTTPYINADMTATLFLRTCDIQSCDTIFEEFPFPRCVNDTTQVDTVKNQPLTVEAYRERLNRFLSLL